MTSSFKMPCAQPGCFEVVEAGQRYCLQHKRDRMRRWKAERMGNPEEAERQRFYSSRIWQRLRNWWIARHPLCAHCGSTGDLVDHVQPIATGGARLSLENLQTLCTACHAVKSARDRVLAY